jgi:hypothetical protein
MTSAKIDPKNITEETTLAELREQLQLHAVISLRIYPSLAAALEGHPELLEASVHHATGFYVGRGLTEAIAIEAAFSALRRALLPEPLKQYLKNIEES